MFSLASSFASRSLNGVGCSAFKLSNKNNIPINNASLAFLPTALFQLQLVSNFSKYISKARAKRLPLTTKRVGKGFYKGKGARPEGRLTSKGMFVSLYYIYI